MGDMAVRLVIQDNKQFAGVVFRKDHRILKNQWGVGETSDDVWERLRSKLREPTVLSRRFTQKYLQSRPG